MNQPQQFDRLVKPHLATLFRVAYRLVRNTPDADDLVQDTCIAACENLVELAAVDHPRYWLLRVMNNRFLNNARRRRRAPFVPMEDSPAVAQLPSSAPGPEELMEQSDGERALERAFLRLTEEQRTLLSLRAEGYGLAEIATVIGADQEVLRARLHRARSRLAQHLDQPQGHALGSTLRSGRV